MNGVSFDQIHSYRQLGIILGNPEIERPKGKTSYLEVPGRDGALDLSEAFGELRFNQRKVILPFKLRAEPEAAEQKISEVANLLSGKKLKITLDKDPQYYYLGRLEVEGKYQHPVCQIIITALCDPYKYKREVTEETFTVNGSLEINLSNDRMTTYPVVTTTNSMLITKDDITYSYGAVVGFMTQIPLVYGDNLLTITGNGNITLTYQEGSL